jgi:hypothetical protein
MARVFSENGSVIALGSPAGREPMVYKIGRGGEVKKSFLAYDSYWLGFDASIGDLNNNGFEEVVIGAGPGGGPQVRIFNHEGGLVGQFFAYDKLFRGGVNIALGDVNGNGRAEIVTSPGPGGGPHILVYNEHAEIIGNFMAHDLEYRGGVKLAVGDVDNDEHAEIAAAISQPNKTSIKIFRRSGTLVNEFFINKNIINLQLASQDVAGGAEEEILAGYEQEGVKYIEIFDKDGNLLDEANYRSEGEIFDLKSFYDYITGESFIIVAEHYDGQMIVKYFDSRLDYQKEIIIDL